MIECIEMVCKSNIMAWYMIEMRTKTLRGRVSRFSDKCVVSMFKILLCKLSVSDISG